VSRGRRQSEVADGLRELVRGGKGSMTEGVTDALREAIISGALPPDTWLREDEVALSLDVSRTPVREALQRLTEEGLTRRVANRGTIVAPMTTEELVQVYSVWEALEALAARDAAGRHRADVVEQMLEVHTRMLKSSDPGELAELNLEFHRMLRRASGNPLLERFLQNVEHAVRRFPIVAFSDPESTRHALDDHQAILDAIAAGDPDAAQRAGAAHMQHVRRMRVEQLIRSMTS
jgi:DNA-binding GntR family transcriptional regulator